MVQILAEPGTIQQACRVTKIEPLVFVFFFFRNRGRRVVQRLVGSTYWLTDMFAPYLQSTGTLTCQCVRTSTVERANVGSNATKVGRKVGSRTLEPSWLHAIT